MKKLIIAILAITVVGVGLYLSLPTNHQEEEYGVLIGLNGQESYYLLEDDTEGVLAAEDLDKTKLPTYLFDLEDNKVSFQELGNSLKLKYFNLGVSPYDNYKVGSKTTLRMEILNEDMTIDELMARTILMIEELSLYEYWLIGSSELYLQIKLNYITLELFIYMPSLLSDGFTLTVEDYYYENWEIELSGYVIDDVQIEFDLVNTQLIYDTYILEETYIGYVLNYSE